MDYHANAREMGQSQDTDYDGLHSPKLNQVSGSYPHRRMALYVAPFALSLFVFYSDQRVWLSPSLRDRSELHLSDLPRPQRRAIVRILTFL